MKHDDLTFNVIGATMAYYNLTFNMIGATMAYYNLTFNVIGPTLGKNRLLAYINQEFGNKAELLRRNPCRVWLSLACRGAGLVDSRLTSPRNPSALLREVPLPLSFCGAHPADDCSFVVEPEVRQVDSSSSILLSQDFLVNSSFFVFPYKLWNYLF